MRNYFAYIPLGNVSSGGLASPDNILTQIMLNYGCCQITQMKVQMITG